MATYVNNLRLKEIATGDESGTWGTSTNTNLELVGEGLGFGTEAITTNADTHASTVADGSADEARAMYIKYTGTLDSACTITIGPNTLKRVHFIENGTSGSQNIIIKQGSGSTVTIGPGDVKVVYLDGAGSGAAVNDAFASLSTVDLKVSDDLTVTDDASVGGDLLVSGEVQTANIGFTDGDNAITIADGGGITAANGITSTAASNSFGATSFNDANITNVGDIALDSLSADGSSISIASPVVINGTTPSLTIGDAGAEDTSLVFDGNAKDFYVGLDDSADKLVVGVGSTVGTNSILTLDDDSLVIGDGAAVDTSIVFDGNAQDFYIALDDSADDLLIGNGSTVGSNVAIGINESQVVQFNGAYTFPTSDGSADQVLKTNGSGALSFGSVSAGTPSSISDADEDIIRFDVGGSEKAFIKSDFTHLDRLSINDTGDFDDANTRLHVRGTDRNDGPLAIRNDSGDQSSYRHIHYYKKQDTTPVAITGVDITGSAVTHTFISDERLKDELGAADGMNLISELNPIKFKFKDNTGTGSQGFTAQAFKQAFDNVGSYPRGVTIPDNADDYWFLDDTVLIPNLVKAIQELEARISTLEG
jgi:hypothetical protein